MGSNSSTLSQSGQWRPHAGWIALALCAGLYSFGSNIFEFVRGDILRDMPVMIVPHPLDRLLDDIGRTLMSVIGLVILLRAWGRRSTFVLGVALITLSAFPLWQQPFGPALGFILTVSFTALLGPFTYLMAAFAMFMLEESDVAVPKVAKWIFWFSLALSIIIAVGQLVQRKEWAGLVDFTDLLVALKMQSVSFVLAMGLLFYGWMKGGAVVGQRLFLLFLAVSVIISGNLLFSFTDDGSGIFPREVTNTASAIRIAGALLFAYAILKHRIIDLGFAVNRTLVYGAVTFTILTAFGLVEYLAKITIPHAWPQAGPIITAGIAVLLFLSFHQVHHWFEHHIERLFFHSWHIAEAQLKRFVASAGQFVSASALCRELVGELRHYAKVPDVALFLRRDDGTFCRECGELDGARECYDEEDRAFALMRAEREPIELGPAHSSLPGELAVPMLDQQGLSGFVLLGGKPDGTHFRPDELENIGWATQQVGLDLQALQARELATVNASLNERLASVEDQLAVMAATNDRLLAMLGIERQSVSG